MRLIFELYVHCLSCLNKMCKCISPKNACKDQIRNCLTYFLKNIAPWSGRTVNIRLIAALYDQWTNKQFHSVLFCCLARFFL
jgi:hypothetical protein